MCDDHRIDKQTTTKESAGINEAAGNLVNFWQHQLKRIKEQAEDLERLGGKGRSLR